MSLDHLALLGAAQDDFLALLRDADPTTQVPWCGDWTVREMAVHLADIHHWAAGQARREQETPLETSAPDVVELYGRCAAELRATLRALPAHASAWTLIGDGTVDFWHRRQLHETLVHLWDLRVALALAGSGDMSPRVGGVGVRAPAGAPVPRFDPAWARPMVAEAWDDTVDEVVTVMHPRQVRLGRCPALPATIHLVATDTGRRWTLEHASAAPSAEVAGPAAALALLLWRRVLPQDPALQVTGDRSALDAALALRLTP